MASFLTSSSLLKETLSSLVSIIRKKNEEKSQMGVVRQQSTGTKPSLSRNSTLPGLNHNDSFNINKQIPKFKISVPVIKPKLSENPKKSRVNRYESKDDSRDSNLTTKKSILIPPKRKKDVSASILLEQEKSIKDTVSIEISVCSNANLQKCINNFHNNFLTPLSLNPDASPLNKLQNKIKKRKNSTAERTVSPSTQNNNAFEDPFYYGNIKKNSNFSAFHTIIDRKNEMLANPFPYCSRIGKSPKKKTSIKARPLSTSMSILECTCKVKKSKSDLKAPKSDIIFSLPEICEIKMHIPYLAKIYFCPQNVTCFRNLVVINFEGALGCFTSVIYIKSGAFKVLRQISKIFQLVLVISMEGNGKDEIIPIFARKNVKLAGVYASVSPSNIGRETNKLQNYSQIYTDFDCHKPHESILVISAHKFAEEIIDIKDIIYLQRGVGPKFNISRVPIGTLQYPEPPCTVLIPD